jgi:hypothetical protein
MSDGVPEETLWLRDDRDHVISFRDRDAAVRFSRMVEASEAFLRVLPSVQPARLQTHLCEFDNNGYVIQLKLPRTRIPESGVIVLSPGRV